MGQDLDNGQIDHSTDKQRANFFTFRAVITNDILLVEFAITD